MNEKKKRRLRTKYKNDVFETSIAVYLNNLVFPERLSPISLCSKVCFAVFKEKIEVSTTMIYI